MSNVRTEDAVSRLISLELSAIEQAIEEMDDPAQLTVYLTSLAHGVVAACRPWMQHTPTCDKMCGYWKDETSLILLFDRCTCGLDAFLAGLIPTQEK